MNKNWLFTIFQVIFWVAFAFLMFLGVIGVLYEDDIPLAGFFWAGLLAIIYWLIKKYLFRINKKK